MDILVFIYYLVPLLILNVLLVFVLMVIYRKIKQKDKVRPAWWFFLVSIVIGQIAFYMITHTFEQQSSGGYRLEPQLEHPLDSTKNH